MPQPSQARTAQWQVRRLAELTRFNARCRAPGQLLARAQTVLVQSYGAVQVQLGPQRRHGCAFPAALCDSVPEGVARLLRREAGVLHAVPFFGEPVTGHGLLLRLARRTVAGWAAPAARVLDAADGELLRSIASMLHTAFERRQKNDDRRLQVRRVIRAKHEWQAVADALPQGLVLMDKSSRILRVNRTMETWGLIPVKRACGRPLGAVLGRLQPLLAPMLTAALADLQPDSHCAFDAEHPTLLKRLRLTLRRLPCQGMSGGAHALLVFDDVTGQHEADEAMAEYSQRLETIVQACTLALTDEHPPRIAAASAAPVNFAGTALVRQRQLVFCDAAFARLVGYPVSALTGCPIDVLLQEAFRAGWPHTEGAARNVQLVCSDGSKILVRSRTSMVDMPEGPGTFWQVIDAGSELRIAGELHRLSDTLVHAEERERKRVAMELHDGIGQSLSAIRIGLEARRAGAPRQCRECAALTDVDTQIRDAIDEVRRISLALRPPMLDDLGLLPTLEWLLREFSRAPSGPSMVRRFDAREEHIPRPLRAVIFRILQEALRNVVEHAHASHIDVLLTADGHTVAVSVRDNGRGFEPAALRQAERPGFGLMAMRERAEMSGGSFTLHAVPGEGTLVQVHWRTG